MIVTVQRCIGCGAVSTPQPCLGTCADRRLDLVDAGEHAAALAAVAALEARLDERRRLLEQVVDGGDWEALRSRARAALHTPPVPEPGSELTTWACDSCGRIEAPQECIGVCIRPDLELAPATEHRAVISRARALGAALAHLERPLRMLAWTTPRPGHRDETRDALRLLTFEAQKGLTSV